MYSHNKCVFVISSGRGLTPVGVVNIPEPREGRVPSSGRWAVSRTPPSLPWWRAGRGTLGQGSRRGGAGRRCGASGSVWCGRELLILGPGGGWEGGECEGGEVVSVSWVRVGGW